MQPLRNNAQIHLYYGQPGTGKTFAAREAYDKCNPERAVIIDGDTVRQMWPGIGYDPESRELNQKRIIQLAQYFYNMHMDVFVATVCPTTADRRLWRASFPPEVLHMHYMDKVFDESKFQKHGCKFFDIPHNP